MAEYSKYNLVYRLQKWMDSVPGQTFLNYAYSWGASIVILGTLFKLTHLPGANIMLFLGMGTEVIVFFLSAFDRPFDKTADGRDLPTHVEDDFVDSDAEEDDDNVEAELGEAVNNGAPAYGGPSIIFGGGVMPSGSSSVAAASEAQAGGDTPSAIPASSVVGGTVQVNGAWVAEQQEATPDMVEAQGNYVDALNSLTEMLQKVSAQSERLTRDSEEMENLNRTLTGITKIYEMQLKAASQQVGTIDQINDQTKKMAELIEQLNSIYTRMIDAMTANMVKG